jgi:hypothetical protein
MNASRTELANRFSPDDHRRSSQGFPARVGQPNDREGERGTARSGVFM